MLAPSLSTLDHATGHESPGLGFRNDVSPQRCCARDHRNLTADCKDAVAQPIQPQQDPRQALTRFQRSTKLALCERKPLEQFPTDAQRAPQLWLQPGGHEGLGASAFPGGRVGRYLVVESIGCLARAGHDTRSPGEGSGLGAERSAAVSSDGWRRKLGSFQDRGGAHLL